MQYDHHQNQTERALASEVSIASRSLTYNINNSGPSILPCGTPVYISFSVLFLSSNLTICFLFKR